MIVKVDVRWWLALYLLVLATLNILNAYDNINVTSERVFLFFLCCLALVFGLFLIKPFNIDLDGLFSQRVRRLVILSGITILMMYFYQGMPSLIEFRTNNQHSIGILWIVLIAVLMVSAFFVRQDEYVFILFILFCILLTGSRLNLLVFFIFFLSRTRMRFKVVFTKFIPLAILLVVLSTAVGSFREGGKNFSLQGNFQELVDRNVALRAGLEVVNYNCFTDISLENPIYLLVPRFVYPSKEIMFNIRAFMCYYDKQDVPSKSNGFFMSEMILAFGELVDIVAPLLCLVYSVVLSLMYNSMVTEFKSLVLPLLFVSVFGPIDGFYSASVQIFLGIVMLFLVSLVYRLITE